jgi:hypothetical protein
MTEIPELPNPFTGGKILGCGIDPKEYIEGRSKAR